MSANQGTPNGEHPDRQDGGRATGNLVTDGASRSERKPVQVAKGIGSTEWHSHDDQDELFLVTHGEMVVELRAGDVRVASGELFVVRRGEEYRPRAVEAVRFLIVGSSITSNAAGGKPAWSHDEVPADPQ